MTPLDPRHPLWQFHLVEDYEGGSALVARIHHCIGDGIALISVMMSITDGGTDPPRRRKKTSGTEEESDWLNDAVLKPLSELTAKAIGMYSGGKARAADILANPQQPLLGSMDMARTGLKVVNDVAALALMPDDSPTLLKGKPKAARRWWPGASPSRWTMSRPSARPWAARSTTCCCPAWPGPSANTCWPRGRTRRARRSAPWCR
jgi:hypothetical protein